MISDNQFNIVVDKDYLALMTPYSDEWLFYDDMDSIIEDLKYCIAFELFKKKGKKK